MQIFTNIFVNVDIYGLTSDKTIADARFANSNNDICTMRRYIRNILRWNKNDIKGKRMTTGDYYFKLDSMHLNNGKLG